MCKAQVNGQLLRVAPGKKFLIVFHCIGIAASSDLTNVLHTDSNRVDRVGTIRLCDGPLPPFAQAYLVLGLNTVCDVYFAGSIDLLCDAWNLTPDVAGVTWPEPSGTLMGQIVQCSA